MFAREWTRLAPIVMGFVVASVAFSIATPLLEAPDEPSHVAMVRYLATHRTLPVQRPPADFPVGQEGSQPPLYYALGALLFSLSPAPDLAPTWEDHNPYADFSRSREPRANRNLYAHTAEEGFPYRGDVLGVRLVRMLGVLLGIVTVVATFLIARDLVPTRPAVRILAAALVAFNPQFVFLSGVVNNDGAVAASATVVLWLLVRWAAHGGGTGRALLLGLALGATLLTKLSAGLIVPLVGVVFVGDLLRERRARPVVVRALIVASAAAFVAGWWFLRNLRWYGDPLGWDAMLAAAGSMIRAAPLSALAAVEVLWNARGTYWGALGWTNIFFNAWVYRVLDALVGAALVGLLVGLCRRRSLPVDRRRALQLAVVTLWPLLVLGGLVRWVQINQAADQGRLLFPAIGAIAVLLALGLDELRLAGARVARAWFARPSPPARRRPQRAIGLLAGPAALGIVGVVANAAVLWWEIVPAFSPRFEHAAESRQSAALRFGDDVELLEHRISPARLKPGDELEVEFVWRARRPIDRNWAVSVSLRGEGDAVLAQVESWPQGGRAPTTAWPPGAIVRDRYRLTPRWEGSDPFLAQVWLGVYDPTAPGGPALPITDAQGRSLGTGTVIGHVSVRPAHQADWRPSRRVDARFGDAVRLLGYDLALAPSGAEITLYWQAIANVPESYTVFAHLLDRSGALVSQHDGLPRGGLYPTSAWEAGEVVRDRRVLALPDGAEGSYRIHVGLYKLETGQRLPAYDARGVRAPEDALLLATLDGVAPATTGHQDIPRPHDLATRPPAPRGTTTPRTRHPPRRRRPSASRGSTRPAGQRSRRPRTLDEAAGRAV
ncbi:MAG TPA: glycosyltransferase family 39 protein [Chloroflexota bacterium]